MADTPQIQPAPSAAPPGQAHTNVEGQQPPAQAETKDLSSQYAHLAKKEKNIREAQRKFQADRQAFESERESWKTQNLSKYQGFEDRISKDPLGLLEERGVTRDQLASLLLNTENSDVANLTFQLQQENKALRTEIEKINRKFDENEKGAYEGAVNQIRNDAKILINSDAAEFELVNQSGDDGIEAIVELCKLAWNEDQVLLPVEDAAKQVELELLERSMKLANANKVKAKLSQAQQPTEPQKTLPNQSKTQPTKTLNSQAAQATSKPVSARERAILAFKGQL